MWFPPGTWNITDDKRIRTDVRTNKVHADALRMCTRNLGVDCACGGAHRRQGRGDASKAVQGQDDHPEALASSGMSRPPSPP